MNNGTKNMVEDGLENMAGKVDNCLNKIPAGMDDLELEETKEELELLLELIKK